MAKHKQPELPYRYDALEPHVSTETLQYHYKKHHAGYVKKLNDLVKGTNLEGKTLEELIRTEGNGKVFNNAAQTWNHTFYWNSMTPNRDSKPSKKLEDAICRNFGSMRQFKHEFAEVASGQFGSGWAWLVQDNVGELAVMPTSNADSPLLFDFTPLIVCDVWEHAYYIDYRNDRGAYVDKFLQLIDWKFASTNYNASANFAAGHEQVAEIA